MTDRNDIHRLLDEAFTGVEMTADAQDLKEEVRANLVARVAELEADGQPAGDAVRRAIAELGDVRELLGEPTAQPDEPRRSGLRRDGSVTGCARSRRSSVAWSSPRPWASRR